KIHAAGGLTTAIAHMPVQGRNPDVFQNHDQVFGVSQWVVDGLFSAGLPVWPAPLYGVANLERVHHKTPLICRSRYDWDLRKGRDRIFSWIEPWVDPFLPHRPFERRNGLTLGIVSRITPIKQFPLLFERLSPIMTQFPDVQLEIFGSGGYASIRDLTRALRPIRDQVRFWGDQSDVASVYQGIDYLLTGLPEKEALGLNVIEAMTCGTPVLAPAAPPFTETIIDGATGFLYRDPREDAGADFARLIEHLRTMSRPPDPRSSQAHLDRFSFTAFVARLQPVIEWAHTELSKRSMKGVSNDHTNQEIYQGIST
ncbi:glycosyltransferase family 4 protein, partial [Candidatus Kaiserbacteria bacterium]|nr:glycosyltransferase family 4 protein [Candidatus Kaiserbacteria bacterium]